MAENQGNEHQELAEAFANAAQRKSFFFEPPSRLQLVEKLEHLSRFSDFLLLIQGPEGAGKTTLLKRLAITESDRTQRVCFIDAAESGELSHFLKQLSEQLSSQIITETDNQQMLNGIYEFVQVMAAEHIQWIIIIDNAEQLDQAAMKLLLQMLSDAQGLPMRPHLLMAGSDSLTVKLEQQDEYAALEAQVHRQLLEPFSDTEAAEYLKLRYSAAEALSEKQLQDVCLSAGGYPGGLNIRAEQMFRSGSVSRPSTSPGMPKAMLGVVVGILLVVLAGALWQFWPDSSGTDSERTQVQLQVPIEKEAVPAVVASAPVQEITLNQPAGQSSEPVVKQTQAAGDVIKKPLVAEAEQAVSESETVAAETETVLNKPAIVAVEKKQQVAVKAEPVAAAVVKAPEPAPETEVKPVTQPVTKALSSAETALLEWPETSYTLQVLGAGVRSSAEKFIRGQSEPQKFYLFETLYKNKPWFVVVYGQYKDRTTASEASKKLPPELAKLKPWARSVQGIQADLATRK